MFAVYCSRLLVTLTVVFTIQQCHVNGKLMKSLKHHSSHATLSLTRAMVAVVVVMVRMLVVVVASVVNRK